MTPDIEKIEHLLSAKAFTELSAAERELVLGHLSGAAEYEHMRETLARVKKVFVAEAASLAADADLKEQILNRFEQNKALKPSPAERAALFFQTLVPSPMGRLAGALAMLLLVISVAFFAWPKQVPELAQQLLPPATEPQIVTLIDNTPPRITLAVEKARATVPVEEQQPVLSTITAAEADGAAYDVVARTDQNEFIVAGFERQNAGNATATEDLKVPEEGKYMKDEAAPPVYLNQQGLYQYQNSRVADAGTYKEYSDAYKNYSEPAKAKKLETEGRLMEKNSSMPGKPTAAGAGTPPGENMEVVIASKQRKGAVTAFDDVAANAKVLAAPVPVWPGVESQTNAYVATLESVKAFFGKETGMAYRMGSQEYLSHKTVRLSLMFNGMGVITKVHVSGDVNEAQKKAFIQRALQLPAFHFTTGAGKPLLEQTYILELY